MASIVLVSFLWAGCTEKRQAPESSRSSSDHLRLNDPVPDSSDLPTSEELKHCLILSEKGYALIINGTRYEHSTETQLRTFIDDHKQDVTNRKLTIIPDPETPYTKLVDVLDVMTLEHIENYQVKGGSQMAQAHPHDLPTNADNLRDIIDTTDQKVLRILILKGSFRISFDKKTEFKNSIAEVEKFIQLHFGEIDREKVVVVGSKDLGYNDVMPLLNLMAKYNFLYHMMAEN
jgi:biopolymer transport protein ExbD